MMMMMMRWCTYAVFEVCAWVCDIEIDDICNVVRLLFIWWKKKCLAALDSRAYSFDICIHKTGQHTHRGHMWIRARNFTCLRIATRSTRCAERRFKCVLWWLRSLFEARRIGVECGMLSSSGVCIVLSSPQSRELERDRWLAQCLHQKGAGFV